MKARFLIVWILMIVAAGSQQVVAQDYMQSERRVTPGDLWVMPSSETDQNKLVIGNIALSGITIDLVKAENPLQLINPFAPTTYSSPEDNTLRNPITGRAEGLKLFSIRF